MDGATGQLMVMGPWPLGASTEALIIILILFAITVVMISHFQSGD
jgi:hypothetical protein